MLTRQRRKYQSRNLISLILKLVTMYWTNWKFSIKELMIWLLVKCQQIRKKSKALLLYFNSLCSIIKMFRAVSRNSLPGIINSKGLQLRRIGEEVMKLWWVKSYRKLNRTSKNNLNIMIWSRKSMRFSIRRIRGNRERD